jgi:hypothetical protein
LTFERKDHFLGSFYTDVEAAAAVYKFRVAHELPTDPVYQAYLDGKEEPIG